MDNDKKIKENKEFWDVDRAVKRLIWRLSPNNKGEYNTFKPTKDDFNAFKSILGSLDREKNKSVSYAPLFAKLYLFVLTQNIRFYETTFFSDFPTKDLHRMLDTPIELFFKSFYNDFTSNQLNKLSDSNSVKINNEIINDYKKLQETFTYDLIKGQLIDLINKALKTYK